MTRNQCEACNTASSMGWKSVNVYEGFSFDIIPIPGMIVYKDFQNRLWQVMPDGRLEEITQQDIDHERSHYTA